MRQTRTCSALIAAVLVLGAASPALAQDEKYDPDARLAELGIELPTPPSPVANYVNGVQTGNLIFLEGRARRGPMGPRSMASSAPTSPLRRGTRPQGLRP